METKFYQETTRKRSHLKEGAEKMQEQTQIGDKMKVDLDIGESEMLEVYFPAGWSAAPPDRRPFRYSGCP